MCFCDPVMVTHLSVGLEEPGRLRRVERNRAMRLNKAGSLGAPSGVSWESPRGEASWGSAQQEPPTPTPATRKPREARIPFPWWTGSLPARTEGSFLLPVRIHFNPDSALFPGQTWGVSLTL